MATEPTQQEWAELEAAAERLRRHPGTRLNRREEQLRRKARAWEEERRVRDGFGAVPQRIFVEWTGRTRATVLEAAERYGMPVARDVDVRALVRWMFDLLARHGRKLSGPELPAETDPMLVGGDSPALERYRNVQADLATLTLEERRRNLLPRDQVHENNMRLSSILRRAGEQLEREFGVGALDIMESALDEYEAEVERVHGGGADE